MKKKHFGREKLWSRVKVVDFDNGSDDEARRTVWIAIVTDKVMQKLWS